MKIPVVGFDPSLRNWGCAAGYYCTDSGLVVEHVSVIQSVRDNNKQVRNNSKDLNTAADLFTGALRYAKDAKAVFIEIPVGSQSSRAMASYGICVGVIGSLQAVGVPVYQVTPTEVKLASVGSKTASKQEMINWAYSLYPDINWEKHKDGTPIASSCEHMADAVGAIHAGVQLGMFQQLLSLI